MSEHPTPDRPSADSLVPEHRSTVRTFTPRWRMSPLTEERMTTLLPRFAVPEGGPDLVAALGDERPVVLEIGSGHGAAALAYAQAHPEHLLVTAEIYVPGVARMMARADEAGLTNLRVHRGDALELLATGVAPGSLEAVHLFFPDPWPKKRHAKRRFVQQDTLDLIRDRLRPGGQLLVATDHGVYAEHALEQLAEHGGFEVTVGERPVWRPRDGFEEKGRRAGREITEIRAVVR